MDVRDKMNGIFREVFNDDTIQIKPETTANDIEGWDSFSHVTLITAIEIRFNIKFSIKEFMSFKSVGDLIRCIERKVVV
ncbi:MAG: acyl carrier protein [Candidatus Omnitrophota bacterium]|jgi:acyl carrier protein